MANDDTESRTDDSVETGDPQTEDTENSEKEEPKLELVGSRLFTSWLRDMNLSIVFTTYQAGRIFFIGTKPDGGMSVFQRSLSRCMGLCFGDNSLYVSTLYQLWRFENALEPGQIQDGFDRVYLPQVGYITGDVDIHDMAIDSNGQLIFVNTLFNCLATVSDTHSFAPVWQPPYITKLAAEDRCHLNGLAMENGSPRYATAVSETDIADGWRGHRRDGGVVIDIPSNTIIARGLSMPHSPRLHQGKLWMLESGSGYFGYVDTQTGKFERMTFCPGFLRGLTIHDNYALVGLSLARDDRKIHELELSENLKSNKAEPRCAVYIIDLRTGDVVHWLRVDGFVEELYDVAVIPGAIRPMMIGFQTEEIRRTISIAKS